MKFARYKHDSSVSYTLGATLTYELIKNAPERITRIFLRPNIKHGNDLDAIIEEARRLKLTIIESDKPFNVLGSKDNCLLMAEFAKIDQSLDNTQNHIVLVNPSDAGNLGTIMRTAAGMNYQNLAIVGQAVDFYDPKAIRSSMGAMFHLNIKTYPTIEEYLEENSNRELFAFMLDAKSRSIEDIAPETTYSLIFGNEAAGLPDDFADFCQPVIIPQSNQIDSLNLSVAASIAMYEFSKK